MKVIVDTSIWVDHFRRSAGNRSLIEALERDDVLLHDFVRGEILLGGIHQDDEILSLLSLLPGAVVARQEDVEQMIEHRRLWGRGIGWVDAHLIASALISDADIYTMDRKLGEVFRLIKN